MSIPYNSFWETVLKKELTLVYWKQNVIFNYRPDFLRNPKTWKNLEIDIYVKNYYWVEFQWWQHYTDKNQIFRDELKLKLCKQNWLKLYRVTLKWLKSFLKKVYKDWNYQNQIHINQVFKEIDKYLENVQKKFKKDKSLKKAAPKQRAIKSIKKDVKNTLKKK